MKKIYIIGLSILCLGIACKTNHLMQVKFTNNVDATTVGVIMRLDQSADNSTISNTVEQALMDCSVPYLKRIFVDEIYQEENFKKLFTLDSVFYQSQPTLSNLKHLLVIQTKIIKKKDDKGKNTIGAEFLGKWVTPSPLKLQHQFYYVEKITATGAEGEHNTVLSYLSGQILKKLCTDIHQHISKTK